MTSELIGIIATLVVVSMLGGWFVRRSAARIFEQKWAAFRNDLASWILVSQKQLEEDFFYLGKDMIRIAEKPVSEINAEDIDFFRRKRKSCLIRCSELLAIFERAHFSLRTRDITPASKYITALRTEFLQKLDSGASHFEQFDARLTMHLQGLCDLQSYMVVDKGITYRDILIASANEADTEIMGTDREAVLRLGRALAEQLKK
ncbi:hypothetical protein [Paracoccus ravus]|uniref:hypothetical protein n=1 Tax=Paracoccus ravus TaxID=2447760 RepID=UPI00106DEC8C|nr:hypothetical protein [Paracoccus ravus]